MHSSVQVNRDGRRMLSGSAVTDICMVQNIATVSSSSLPFSSLYVIVDVLWNEYAAAVLLGELHVT
jgi:hypothetical protein